MGLRDEFISLTAARQHWREKFQQLASGNLERVVVLHKAEPVAVLLGVTTYEQLLNNSSAIQQANHDIDLLLERIRKLEEVAPKEDNWESYGRVGGLTGGHAGGMKRASVLEPERRSEIARKAAETRWGKSENSPWTTPTE